MGLCLNRLAARSIWSFRGKIGFIVALRPGYRRASLWPARLRVRPLCRWNHDGSPHRHDHRRQRHRHHRTGAVVCGTGGRIACRNSYALTQVDVVVDTGFIGAARPRFFLPPFDALENAHDSFPDVIDSVDWRVVAPPLAPHPAATVPVRPVLRAAQPAGLQRCIALRFARAASRGKHLPSRRTIHRPERVSRSPFANGRVGFMREKDNPMKVGLKRISTVVGLLAVTASAALAQGTAANPNQMTADSVASACAQPGAVRFPNRDRGPGWTGQPGRNACQSGSSRPRPWPVPSTWRAFRA